MLLFFHVIVDFIVIDIVLQGSVTATEANEAEAWIPAAWRSLEGLTTSLWLFLDTVVSLESTATVIVLYNNNNNNNNSVPQPPGVDKQQ